MHTDFYLLDTSFQYQNGCTIETIEEAVKNLVEDYDYIKEQSDTVFRHEDIYAVNICPDFYIADLYQADKECPLSRDVKKYLQKIIDHSKATAWSNSEIIQLINEQEIENILETQETHGLLALFETNPEVKKEYIVYNQRNWLNFHRYFLAKYALNESHFIDECAKYFPNLYFHERNKDTIKPIFNDCIKKIVAHLSELNDKFNLAKTEPYSRQETMKIFNSIANLDWNASIEGNIKKKNVMTFEFLLNDNSNATKDMYCELHLKLTLDDKGSYDQNRRIYFHEGDKTIQKGKILVGHIGKHL